MLQNLTSLGIDIPNGFVITIDTYRKFLNFNSFERKIINIIKSIDFNNIESLRRKGQQIRLLLQNGRFPKVIAADINEQKRKMALQLGAHAVINPSDDHAVEKLKEEYTRGGADIALEFAGAVPALEFAYTCTKRGGTTITAGLPHSSKRFEISPVLLVGEERTLKGSYLGSCIPSHDIPAFISLYQSGRLPVDKLLSHRLQFEQINEGFERLAHGEANRQIIFT